MKCPKCKSAMEEIQIRTLDGMIEIDRCESCKGIWFDFFEADILREEWMSEIIDTGDPKTGKAMGKVQDVTCPRCSERMDTVSDKKQPHIEYEMCMHHGVFMDAGEFTDYKNRDMLDFVKDMFASMQQV